MMTELLAQQSTQVVQPALSEEQARQLVDQINGEGARLVERAAQLEVDKEDFGRLVGMAYEGRAWIALGYESWEELADAEFSSARLFESIAERRERVQALVTEGLTSRAIGAVLGVSYKTAQRDAVATGTDDPVAGADSASADRVVGLDGRERQRRRPTDAEHADRALRVAQRRHEGATQDEIAQELGVSQRTISSDDRMVKAWRDELNDADLERLHAGQMSRGELAERANLEIVSRERRRLDAAARGGARSMTDALGVLGESVVYADAWLEERAETSAILAGPLANVAGESTEWMVLDFDFTDVPDDQLQLLSNDLARATEWARRAQERVLQEAAAREVEVESKGVLEEIEKKLASRRGRQR